MAQPTFSPPDFLAGSSAEEIHARMMSELPDDIDDMPGGFPYDFTRPAADEKSEFINFHLIRALMIAFPQYAWDDWLDLHGQQVHLTRHQPGHASGEITIYGTVGAVISAGVIFCVPAKDDYPAVQFATDAECTIGEEGNVKVSVTAVEAGKGSNVQAGAVSIMARPDRNVTSVTNEEAITGGTEREDNDDFYDRIAAEYESSRTYVGNDSDYKRWAKEAGAGDCIVIPAEVLEKPGEVKLVLVDGNGQPANEALIKAVYDHIVSPDDRSRRILPTACAKLECVAATTTKINYTITGLQYDETTNIQQIKEDFKAAMRVVYEEAKSENLLRYNDQRPVISALPGVVDFSTFLVNGAMDNIILQMEEYPEIGDLDFS